MNKNILLGYDDVFEKKYNQWRLVRVVKLEQIFGINWFKGKKILELGCGYGNIGLYFQDLGADVTFVEGKQEFIDVLKSKCPTAKVIKMDLDGAFELNEQYDLVIHWGLLYNINHWKDSLRSALAHARYLTLESNVNRYDYDIEFKVKDFDYGIKHCGIMNDIGSLPSISLIEKELPLIQKRYDDKDLNIDSILTYTYICNDSSQNNQKFYNTAFHEKVYGGRKFWVVDTQKE